MPEFKNITISIPLDVYERVETLCPGKRCGQNRIRDFYTNIFLQGVESPEFLKAEKRRLETKIKLLEPLVEQNHPQFNSAAFDSVARDVEECQDIAAKTSKAKLGPDGSSEAVVPSAQTGKTDGKPAVH